MNTDNYYVVNCAIYNNVRNPQAVDSEVEKIIQKSSQIAGDGRKIAVVIGLNAPNDESVTNEQMIEATQRIQELIKAKGPDNIQVHVINYRWERFDDRLKPGEYRANERINYVAIRNNLFYSKENQEVIQEMITEAKSHDQASVKFFALDGDSEVTPEMVEDLEGYWNRETRTSAGDGSIHLPPLITSGYYKFEFDEKDKSLVGPAGELNWGKYLAFIENTVDIESKQLLGAEKFNSELLYRKLSLPSSNDEISSAYILSRLPKIQKNLFVLDKNDLVSTYGQEEIDLLKIHFLDLLSIAEVYKEALENQNENESDAMVSFTQAVILEQMISSLREIEKIEERLEGLENIKYKFSVAGKQVLYPSENVMFVSLYDKTQNVEINLFEEMVSPAKSTAKKVGRLWGNDVGREEGENIASQMRKYWEKAREVKPKGFASLSKEEQHAWVHDKSHRKASQAFLSEREVVTFKHTFTTALPPRAHKFLTDEQQRIGDSLPKTLEALREIAEDPEKLEQAVESCATLISTRSQTSLSAKFLNQRLRYIKGKHSPRSDLKEPGKKLAMMTRAIRGAVASSFENYFQEFQQERIEVLKSQIRKGILNAVNL